MSTPNIFRQAIPKAAPDDIIEWVDSSGIKVDGHSFDSTRTPQLVEPMRAMADAETRIGTLIKPVQVGGSTAGEIICAYWAAFLYWLIQYNWQDDKKAVDRWNDRIKPTLESCRDIKRTGLRFEELKCEARYVNSTVRVQGVFNESSLDSDTVPLQINEEIHLWKPGFLSKARRRQTQIWNAKAFDISNASEVGDQLHSAYLDGTMEQWVVKCPKCGNFHEMRFRFNPSKPELGGLRWDSDGCKMDGGRFNYNKLEKTIRYQFPCGHEIKDLPSERRRLVGKYSEPKNEGAHISHRSWNFEAVSCDAIRWMSLIQEWHSAIRAIKHGDAEPMRRFVTERECRFYDPNEDRPVVSEIVLSQKIEKNREGMKHRKMRLACADWQQGYKSLGQLTHYWLLITDYDEDCNSQIVFEGMVSTDSELAAILKEHEVMPSCVWIDASKNTKQILSLCYREGYNAVSGIVSHRGSFLHDDGVRRFYSPEKPVADSLNVPLKFDWMAGQNGAVYSPQEPIVISYNKAGLLTNHFFIRDMMANVLANNPEAGLEEYIECIIPGDVSEDFKKQMDSWERVGHLQKKTNDEVEGFRKVRKDDHLLMCRAYGDMILDWIGLLGMRLEKMGIKK